MTRAREGHLTAFARIQQLEQTEVSCVDRESGGLLSWPLKSMIVCLVYHRLK